VIVSFIVIVGISLLTALIELLGYTLEMQ